jgi:C1A family cysteine protease
MPTIRSHKRFGWIRDLPDQRDHLYAAPARVLQNLPAAVDLRPNCPPVYDQGELGSCTGNALAGADQFDQLRQDAANPFVPSRLFIYYEERKIEGTVGSDSGAQIRESGHRAAS